MVSRIDSYFSMTHQLYESKSFAKRHIASRLAAFPLIGVEIAEFATHVFHLFSDTWGQSLIRESFVPNPQSNWEKKWSALETLKKVVRLFLGLLSTILIGWWAPGWNHVIHEELRLINRAFQIKIPPPPKYITVHIIHKPKITLPLPSPNEQPILTTPVTPQPSPIPTPKKLANVKQISPPRPQKQISPILPSPPPHQHMTLNSYQPRFSPVNHPLPPVKYSSSSTSVTTSCTPMIGALLYDPILTIRTLFFEFMMRMVMTH